MGWGVGEEGVFGGRGEFGAVVGVEGVCVLGEAGVVWGYGGCEGEGEEEGVVGVAVTASSGMIIAINGRLYNNLYSYTSIRSAGLRPCVCSFVRTT